jgi:hypothetical protein
LLLAVSEPDGIETAEKLQQNVQNSEILSEDENCAAACGRIPIPVDETGRCRDVSNENCRAQPNRRTPGGISLAFPTSPAAGNGNGSWSLFPYFSNYKLSKSIGGLRINS